MSVASIVILTVLILILLFFLAIAIIFVITYIKKNNKVNYLKKHGESSPIPQKSGKKQVLISQDLISSSSESGFFNGSTTSDVLDNKSTSQIRKGVKYKNDSYLERLLIELLGNVGGTENISEIKLVDNNIFIYIIDDRFFNNYILQLLNNDFQYQKKQNFLALVPKKYSSYDVYMLFRYIIARHTLSIYTKTH